MEWNPPSFEEVTMNAEIGGYQGEDDREAPIAPISEGDTEEG